MGNNLKNRFQPLRQRADFLALSRRGSRYQANDWMVVNFSQNDRGFVRCGWTVPAYTGSAVVRNRLKRWGRQYLRQWAKTGSVAVDINFVLRRKTKDFYKQVNHEDFEHALEKVIRHVEKRVAHAH